MLGLQYFLHNKLQIIRVRPFNHIGPRQSNVFVVPAFASQIAAIEKSKEGTIKVGNLDSFRDFTDVRDMVEKGIPGEVYNIGSGKAVKIADILDMLVSFSKAKIKIETEKSRLRKTDIKSIYCDYSKFKSQTEWVPKTPLLKTLSDTIEYERKRLN
jgi:GDP-4-dehydro-6-deoxy-D-mannose reductase